MSRHVQNLIVGQGLAGSAMAWIQHWNGQSLLVIDREHQATASKVAAGLITPVTGKRLVKSDEYDEYWQAALSFYRRVEQQTQTSLFAEADMIRLFEDESARSAFVIRSEAEGVDSIELWQGTAQLGGRSQPGIKMSPAGRLDVKRYLMATKSYFLSIGSYQQLDVDLDTDLQTTEGRIELSTHGISAERLICCQGAQTSLLFPSVPNNPSRGDILTVSIPDYDRTEVVHRSIWIAPNPDGSQTVGSTYDWKHKQPEPTESGRQEVLKKLGRVVEGTIAVNGHVAAVRPTMKDYEPVIGQHVSSQNIWIMNGLGSKGTLRAPLLAQELQQAIDGKKLSGSRRDVRRLDAQQPLSGSRPRSLTKQAQEAVGRVLTAGDTAIDATVGNGFDTCFMGRLIGESGRLTGFDIQQSALESTRRRLESEGLSNVKLLQQGHETLVELFEENSVSAAMFNLGYLPRHDHKIITQAKTSVRAIESAIKVLKPGGVMTVLAYRGHDGGQEEFKAVERLLLEVAQDYDLRQVHSTPAKSTSPILFVFRKQTQKEQ